MGSHPSSEEYSEVEEQPAAHPTALDGLSLCYFDLPGRGEAVRLALVCAGVRFEDDRVHFADWPKLKDQMPFLTLPVLTLPDGERLSQTQSLLRWIGAESCPRLYPQDPLVAARVDEVMDAVNDAHVLLVTLGEPKEAARKAALEADGVCTTILRKIDAFVGAHGRDGHAVGGSLTIADLKVFWFVCFAVSGFFEGVPACALDEYAHLQRVRSTVGRVPAIKAYYERRAAECCGTPPKFEKAFFDAVAP